MSNLKDFVKDMEVKTFKKIEEFASIPTNITVEEVEIPKKNPLDGEEPTFKQHQAIINDVAVRVPKDVLNQLKEQLAAKDFDAFKVSKSGEGMNTKYTVITL